MHRGRESRTVTKGRTFRHMTKVWTVPAELPIEAGQSVIVGAYTSAANGRRIAIYRDYNSIEVVGFAEVVSPGAAV